jgi:hypothetical protein
VFFCSTGCLDTWSHRPAHLGDPRNPRVSSVAPARGRAPGWF